jgi:hypothetical protein
VWSEPLVVGQPLPEVVLPIADSLDVTISLEPVMNSRRG